MSNEIARCALCGEPMPEGEQMFNYHGYSGPCPKPPLPQPPSDGSESTKALAEAIKILKTFASCVDRDGWILGNPLPDELRAAKAFIIKIAGDQNP